MLKRSPMKRSVRRMSRGTGKNGRPRLPRSEYKTLVARLTVACGSRCENPWCRKWANLDPHHVVKRSQGGLDAATNLVMLCRPCHDDTDRSKDSERWLGVVGSEAPHRVSLNEFVFSKWIHSGDLDFPRQTTYIRYRRIWV